jgi:drug/metabolite transporter (DMT)-like permease
MRDKINLFDLRRIIGGLFVFYGLLLTVLGLFDSQEEIDKAAGVNINLWAGLGMLVFAALMIAWALIRPLADELGSEESGGGPGSDDERPVGDGDAGRQ